MLLLLPGVIPKQRQQWLRQQWLWQLPLLTSLLLWLLQVRFCLEYAAAWAVF